VIVPLIVTVLVLPVRYIRKPLLLF
jgi:hypothetical protein